MTATSSGRASGKVCVFPLDRLCAAHAWPIQPSEIPKVRYLNLSSLPLGAQSVLPRSRHCEDDRLPA